MHELFSRAVLDKAAAKAVIVTMKPPSRYEIVYAPIMKSHVKALGGQYYSLIRRVIEEQLAFEPLRETRTEGLSNGRHGLGQLGNCALGPTIVFGFSTR